NNILGFAPILDVPARAGTRRLLLRGTWFERPAPLPSDTGANGTAGAPATAATLAGVRGLNPFWSVAGRWPAETASPAEALIRRVAEGQGAVLSRASGLMALIAAMAALAAALTVTSATMTGILERRTEIGLLRAMGAGGGLVVGLFLSEAALLGLAGGLIGAAGGAWLARIISAGVFGAPV